MLRNKIFMELFDPRFVQVTEQSHCSKEQRSPVLKGTQARARIIP
jgi:hypothetical protein